MGILMQSALLMVLVLLNSGSTLLQLNPCDAASSGDDPNPVNGGLNLSSAAAYGHGDHHALFDYGDALSKSILFLEVQRSGRLPPNQRIQWRGDSGLNDGADQNVDLVGGYYDAGDNVKFGFPMAFTLTVLAWGAAENAAALAARSELGNVRDAVRWGTDYLLKATAEAPIRIWVQVGDAPADHNCWERPEVMDTPRTSAQVNTSHPGTEVAAETAAALAAAALVFRDHDPAYSALMLDRAIKVFYLADNFRNAFTHECPFYCTYSGYDDELLWAASWLYRATRSPAYLSYVRNGLNKGFQVMEFSWDNKYAGFAVLMSKLYLEGDQSFEPLKSRADFFMCSNLPDNAMTRVSRTRGGLIYRRPGANTQYAAGASFLATMYAKYLAESGAEAVCAGKTYGAAEVLGLARDQVDYILGRNPMGMSYMVGFGEAYPQQAHHRGASIPAAAATATDVDPRWRCVDGFRLWFGRGAPNPNLALGAIVGGPDIDDGFDDVRSNSVQLEPTTYTNALFAGAVAGLLSIAHSQPT